MSLVFADTFYFLGLLNRTDAAHERCVRYSQTHRVELLTTEWVLVELADAQCRPAERERTARFIQQLFQNPLVHIVPCSPDLLQRGLALYGSRQDKNWSLTDCLSFVVMGDRELREALTGDADFEQAGFHALLQSSPG